MTSPYSFDPQFPVFPNGFISWTETHHEIVSIVSWAMSNDDYPEFLQDILYKNGKGGIWELCSNLAFSFENEYVGFQWDGEWFDTLEAWVLEKIKGE
jgi:hypothetical protein